MVTHTPRELQDLLAASVEFPEMGMVKIETEHPVPSLDQLRITLENQISTRFDVSASAEEEYVEEIDLDTFIQAMLTEAASEPRKTIPLSPVPETIPATEAVSTSQATAIDKGKRFYIPSCKRALTMRPKGS